jgi:hypothetical protein
LRDTLFDDRGGFEQDPDLAQASRNLDDVLRVIHVILR